MKATPPATPPRLRHDGLPEVAASFIAFLKNLRRHWPIVIAMVLLGLGAALLMTKMTRPVYRASALLEMEPNPTQPLGDNAKPIDMGAGNVWDAREYYESQYQIIKSNRILGMVARDLGLGHDAGFLGMASPPTIPLADEVLAGILRARVKVEPVKSSHLFNIDVEDTDPKRAARISNAVASTFIEQNLRTSINSSSDAVTWLSGQLESVHKQLEDDENALHEFKERNDLPSTSINEASNMLRLEMQEYDQALTHTKTKAEELSARVAELAKIDATDPAAVSSSELLGNPFLTQLRGQYQDALKTREALLASGKGDNHPLVQEATARVTETKTALQAEIRNIEDSVRHDLDVVRQEEAGEATLFEKARQRAVDLNMKEIEYHRLDRSFTENEKLYELLLNRTKETDLARMLRVNNIRLIDPATVPTSPIRPMPLVNLAIGIVAGILLGLFLPWLRGQLDSTIKTPDDFEDALGVTFLGLLPDVASTDGSKPAYYMRRRPRPGSPMGKLKHVELYVHEQPLSGIAEAARAVRTNLIFMNPDHPYRKLLVTSAAPSEGKTTVACSVAIAFAQSAQRVCIVDADLRRPRLHRIFDRVGDQGLTNVLVGEATIDDVARPTTVDNLWSIPCGPIPPNPGDILHSARMRQFIADLGKRFDRVVIDSPPLVAVTDAAILSKDVDGTLFVTRAFKTTRQLSAQGLRALKDVGATIAGGVLNAVNLRSRDYYEYYHYYRYKRDGYYASQDRPKPSEAENQTSIN